MHPMIAGARAAARHRAKAKPRARERRQSTRAPGRRPERTGARAARIDGLHRQLQALAGARHDALQARFHRSLPFQEVLFDRWERAARLGFGEGSSIYQESYVYGDVKVGAHTWIGPFTILEGTGGIEIGDWCSISSGVQIYTHDSVKWALSGGKAPYERAPVKIGSCTYVGSLAIIARGVTIGTHCVIGAGAFVNRDVPDYSIVAGLPARRIGRVRIGPSGAIRLEYLGQAASRTRRTRVRAHRSAR